MHQEAQKLAISNNKLRSNLKGHLSKLASTRSELDNLKQENEKLVSSYKATNCVCVSTSSNMDDYKSLQDEFEKFKKYHYEEHMKLQTELSYLEDLFRKRIKERVILITYLVCKSIQLIRLLWGITSKLTFLRKPSLYPLKR